MCDLDDWNKLKDYCWCKSKDGYAVSNINGKQPKMHRLIMDCPENMVVDHIVAISHGLVDNRKKNLKICTQKENTKYPKLRNNSKTGYKGVEYNKQKGKYFARLYVDGKAHFKGFFNTLEEAYQARLKLEENYLGKVK